MECRDARRLADAFLSEQLLVETTHDIVSHLEHCPACRAEFDGMRRLRSSTRAAFERSRDLAPRPEFLVELKTRLAAAPLPQVEPTRGQTRREWGMAIAASALVVAGTAFGLREWSGSQLTALLHAATGDHRFCALTFKLAEKPIGLEEAARFDVVNRALALVEPATSVLRGGPLEIVDKHSCVFEGRRFAHIVLKYKGEIVSLVVTADDRIGGRRLGVPGEEPSVPTAADGFRVSTFGQSAHLVFVVSALPDADVKEVAQAMAGPVTRALVGA
jgi:hypothetical protein